MKIATAMASAPRRTASSAVASCSNAVPSTFARLLWMISGSLPAYGCQRLAAMPLCIVTASGSAATMAASVGFIAARLGGRPSP